MWKMIALPKGLHPDLKDVLHCQFYIQIVPILHPNLKDVKKNCIAKDLHRIWKLYKDFIHCIASPIFHPKCANFAPESERCERDYIAKGFAPGSESYIKISFIALHRQFSIQNVAILHPNLKDVKVKRFQSLHCLVNFPAKMCQLCTRIWKMWKMIALPKHLHPDLKAI